MPDHYIRLELRCSCSVCGNDLNVVSNSDWTAVMEPCATCLEKASEGK